MHARATDQEETNTDGHESIISEWNKKQNKTKNLSINRPHVEWVTFRIRIRNSFGVYVILYRNIALEINSIERN